MDPVSTTTEMSLSAEVEEDFNEVSDYISTAYNHTVAFVQHEMERMSDQQKLGVVLIFFISSVMLIVSMVMLFCRKSCCRWFRREEKYVVYRKMVEFDHIIALDPPKSDIGKMPI